MATAAYTRFVYRVWDRLERPAYLDATHIASYCPACLDGTVRVGFVECPRPGLTARCSNGCPEWLIGEVLFE